MGGTSSKNVVTAVTSSMIAIANKSMQQYKTTVNQSNIASFKNCNVSNTILNQTDNFSLNINSIMSSDFQNSLTNEITQAITQIATAVSQNMSVNPASTSASNVAKAIIENKVTLTDIFMQSFNSTYNSKNVVICEGSTLTGDVFNQTIVDNAIIAAVLDANATSSVVNSISQSVSQTAYAKQENALITLALIIIAILGIVFLTGGSVVYRLTDPSFIVTIAPLAISIGLLIVLYAWRQWPFASG